MFQTLINELPYLAVLLVLLIASIFLLALYCFLRQQGPDSSILYFFLATFLYSMYALMTTRTFELSVRNTYIPYLCINLILTLTPIPTMMMFYTSITEQYKPWIRIMCYVSFGNFVAQVTLSLWGIVDLVEMLPVTHGWMLIHMLAMVFILVRSLCVPNPRLQRLVGAASFPLIGIVIDLVRFALIPQSQYPALSLVIGGIVFIVIQIVFFLRDYFTLYQEKVQAEWLQRLAYTDMLTGMQNRNAYEMRLSELDRHPDAHATIWCAVADINNLKQINDTMGHSCGDELIVGAAGLLREAFAEPAEIFRIGGDEFVVLMPDAGATFAKRCLEQLAALTEHHNRQVAIPVSMAMGMDCLQQGDRDLAALITRVDGLMYEDKQRMRRANPAARRAQGSIAPQP